jgi:hypothetical protein
MFHPYEIYMTNTFHKFDNAQLQLYLKYCFKRTTINHNYTSLTASTLYSFS